MYRTYFGTCQGLQPRLRVPDRLTVYLSTEVCFLHENLMNNDCEQRLDSSYNHRIAPHCLGGTRDSAPWIVGGQGRAAQGNTFVQTMLSCTVFSTVALVDSVRLSVELQSRHWSSAHPFTCACSTARTRVVSHDSSIVASSIHWISFLRPDGPSPSQESDGGTVQFWKGS